MKAPSIMRVLPDMNGTLSFGEIDPYMDTPSQPPDVCVEIGHLHNKDLRHTWATARDLRLIAMDCLELANAMDGIERAKRGD